MDSWQQWMRVQNPEVLPAIRDWSKDWSHRLMVGFFNTPNTWQASMASPIEISNLTTS